MTKNNHTYILFLGDLITLFISLYVALWVRYLVFPDKQLILLHLLPFSILILSWCLIFLVVGLYERHLFILKRNIVEVIVNTQIFNCILAALFFYFIPYFSLAPKVILFIYLAVSLVFILIWRLFVFKKITSNFVQNAIIISSDKEIDNLVQILNVDKSYGIFVKKYIGFDKITEINSESMKDINLFVSDFSKQEIKNILPEMYNMIFSDMRFVDVRDLYEFVFGRVPVSLVDHRWLVENVSSVKTNAYNLLKRLIDLLSSLFIMPIFLFFLPFVFLAIKIEDGGKIFIAQKRVGRAGKIFNLYKFRSMNVDDMGKWVGQEDSRVTKVGKFIRKTRIDELPQIINVFLGDLSMIGPRPDIKKLWDELNEEIPFYKVRNIVKPGLSGWAQITQELPPQNIDDTKLRLEYDFYYIKYRSIILDLKIALRTIKTLISRTGM